MPVSLQPSLAFQDRAAGSLPTAVEAPPVTLRALLEGGGLACNAIAWMLALAHHVGMRAGVFRSLLWLFPQGVPSVGVLQRAWFGRVGREMLAWPLKTRLRSALENALISESLWALPRGAVLTFCHSPWDRLASSWCNTHRVGLLVGPERWGPVSRPHGYTSCRLLVAHLARKGRVAVVGDAFGVRGCRCISTSFMDTHVRVTTLPARLAATARAPLVPVLLEWHEGRVRARCGPSEAVDRSRASEVEATLRILDFFEGEIRRAPDVWSSVLKAPAQW